MWRIFFRYYLMLSASGVLFAVGVNKLAEHYLAPLIVGLSRDGARGQFFLAERELQTHPQESWPARLAALQPHFGPELGLVRLSTGEPVPLPATPGQPPHRIIEPLSTAEKAELEAGLILVRRDDGLFAHRIGDSDFIATARDRTADVSFVMVNVSANLALSALLGVILYARIRAQWRDLEKLNAAADRLGRGDLATRVELPRRSDIARAGQQFNAMAARLEKLVDAHSTLTNAVAHELRTPVARLRFALRAVGEATGGAERDARLAACQADLDQLQELVEESLSFARMERGNLPSPSSYCEVHTWLAAAAAEAQLEAETLGKTCTVNLPPPRLEAVLGPPQLTRALGNLTRNALRHAASRIAISLEWTPERCTLQVDDDGPGVPEADRERIFAPFVRLDESRGRDSGGFGLGLAIVRQIAEWHGGSLSVTDSPLGGARFTLQWPTAGRPGANPAQTGVPPGA